VLTDETTKPDNSYIAFAVTDEPRRPHQPPRDGLRRGGVPPRLPRAP